MGDCQQKIEMYGRRMSSLMACRDIEVLVGMMGVIFSEGTPPQKREKIRVQTKSCVVLTEF